MLALSVAYLFGVFFGVVAGLALPWWISGIAGWILMLGLYLHSEYVDPLDLYERSREATPAVGVAFGAWTGAACAEPPELIGAILRPGHEYDGAIIALAVALAWVLTSVADEPEEACRPMVVCAAAYLLTVALVYGLPALEALSWL